MTDNSQEKITINLPLGNLEVYGVALCPRGEYWGISKYYTDGIVAAGIEPESHVNFSGRDLPVWKLEKADYYRTSTSRTGFYSTVNDCVFRAVEKYLGLTGMGGLSHGDKEFFRNHGRVTVDGVDKANVLGVVQSIVSAWGLGIDRVWVPPMSAIGDQHSDFMKALGCNPIAITDSNTSNESMLNMLGIDLSSSAGKDIMADFRFEFSELPKRPCIVMRSLSVTSKVSTQTGINVDGKWSSVLGGQGHADFLGPRDSVEPGEWDIAFTIGRGVTYIDDVIENYNDGGEFSLEKRKAPEEPERLTVWTSVLAGKSLEELGKSASATSLAITKSDIQPPRLSADAIAPGQYLKEYVSVTSKQCPNGCSRTLRSTESFLYCISCNYYEDIDSLEAAAGEQCPFCLSDMSGEICTTCGFDSATWDVEVSTLFICERHELSETKGMVYSIVVEDDDDTEGPMFAWYCPVCIDEDGALIGDLLDARITRYGSLKEV